MRKKGKVKAYNSFKEDSLTYKLQQIATERKRLTGNLIRLCPQPLVTYLYITLFEEQMLILPTVFFVLQMMVMIFDAPACLNRIQKLNVIKKEVVDFLSKYEPHIVSGKEQIIIKKV